ncbi:MAG: hypothetical protein ACYCYR_09480 [Desulfobulbaceae bacterium]
MKGMCQTCGATAPLEWFLAEPIARQVLAAALKLPQPVQDQLLVYLALFRPAGGSSQPKKVLRLVQEIAALVAPGHLQVKGQVARPCPPRIWAQAMEQMTERRDKLQLPLKNNNYLRQIAWSLADQDDARAEAQRNEDALSGGRPSPGLRPPSPIGRGAGGEGGDDGLSQIERNLLERQKLQMKRMEG